MATSDPKLDEITTASQELAAQQFPGTLDFEMEDSNQGSSSEFSTTKDSMVNSPLAKRIALHPNIDSLEQNNQISVVQ